MTNASTSELPSITLRRGTPAQREFRIVTSGVLAQDVWVMNAVRRAGLDAVVVPDGLDAAQLDAFLTTLVTKVFQADVVADLLAGVLVEESRRPALTTMQAWQEYLSEVRDFIATLESSEEKQVLLGLLGQIISGFLSSDRVS